MANLTYESGVYPPSRGATVNGPVSMVDIRIGSTRGQRSGSVLAALFGRETRYVFRLYTQRTFIFMAAIISIVMMLDATTNMSRVLSNHTQAGELQGAMKFAFYIYLRALYVLPSVLPISIIMGIIWTEYGLANSHERIMMAGSGRSPVYALIPACLIGALVGAMQFAALSYARPASVEIQAQGSFRDYGPRFRKAGITEPKWIASAGSFIHARVDFRAGLSLQDITVYKLNELNQLDAVIGARKASAIGESGFWIFENGSEWTRNSTFINDVEHETMVETEFNLIQTRLPVNPLWLSYIDVPPRFLPQTAIENLVFAKTFIPKSYRYDVVYQERLASIPHLIGIALIGAALCQLMFTPNMGPIVSLKISSYGYAIHVSSIILVTLGEYDYLSPPLAVWSIPVCLIAGAVSLLVYQDLKSRRAARPA